MEDVFAIIMAFAAIFGIFGIVYAGRLTVLFWQKRLYKQAAQKYAGKYIPGRALTLTYPTLVVKCAQYAVTLGIRPPQKNSSYYLTTARATLKSRRGFQGTVRKGKVHLGQEFPERPYDSF